MTDKRPQRAPRGRRIVIAGGGFLIILLIILLCAGADGEAEEWCA